MHRRFAEEKQGDSPTTPCFFALLPAWVGFPISPSRLDVRSSQIVGWAIARFLKMAVSWTRSRWRLLSTAPRHSSIIGSSNYVFFGTGASVKSSTVNASRSGTRRVWRTPSGWRAGTIRIGAIPDSVICNPINRKRKMISRAARMLNENR